MDDVEVGAILGASVIHPGLAVETELLKPGVRLDASLLARLRQLGITHLWIDHDLTRDLDAAAAAQLTGARMSMYQKMRSDLGKISRQTVTIGQVQVYRQAVMELVCQLIGSGKYAGMTDQLFTSGGGLLTHGANVAYLATLIGLELENYIVKERPRLSSVHARDLVPLGLGGMLHDIGKSALQGHAAEHHEILDADGPIDIESYRTHTRIGYQMLRDSRAPASATQAVLNHHQRFDAAGWPDMSAVTGRDHGKAQAGHRIHIFTRIVSAANVLDVLMNDGRGGRRLPVQALHEFAGPRFDGWFDPMVRRSALRRIPPFVVGSQVGLNNGRPAVVIAPNLKHPCRPMVRLLDTSAKEPTMVDLSVREDLRIRSYTGIEVEQWLFELPPAYPGASGAVGGTLSEPGMAHEPAPSRSQAA